MFQDINKIMEYQLQLNQFTEGNLAILKKRIELS